MTENLPQLIENKAKTGPGLVAISHLATQIEILEKLYAGEATRDQAYALAAGWIEHGGELRKAAGTQWAKDKKIPLGDEPDPNATPPKPGGLSDGKDAPDVAPGAAGADGNMGKPGADPAPKPEDKLQQAQEKGGRGDFASRLRSAMGPRAAAPAAAHSSIDAAYEAGVRDTTRAHAAHVHRIGRTVARHAFRVGAEAGAALHQKTMAAGNQALAIPTQQVVTHPGTTAPAVMKADLEGLLAKARNDQNQQDQQPSLGDKVAASHVAAGVGSLGFHAGYSAAPLASRALRSKAIRKVPGVGRAASRLSASLSSRAGLGGMRSGLRGKMGLGIAASLIGSGIGWEAGKQIYYPKNNANKSDLTGLLAKARA